MGLPRKGKMSGLTVEESSKFSAALAKRADGPRKPDGTEPGDQKPWIRPLVYRRNDADQEGSNNLPPTVPVSLKNYSVKDASAVKGDTGDLPQTHIFMWTDEDGVRVKKPLSVPEALPHLGHGGEGCPPQAHYFTTASRFSLKHWWIDTKGANGLIQLDTLEFEPVQEHTVGYFTTDIGVTFGGAKDGAASVVGDVAADDVVPVDAGEKEVPAATAPAVEEPAMVAPEEDKGKGKGKADNKAPAKKKEAPSKAPPAKSKKPDDDDDDDDEPDAKVAKTTAEDEDEDDE